MSWKDDYKHKITCTIDHTKIGEDLVDFPLLVALDDTLNKDQNIEEIWDVLDYQVTGDDFTGTEINTSLWELNVDLWSDGSQTSIIDQNDKLVFNGNNRGNATTKFKMSGDFDIQVDFDDRNVTDIGYVSAFYAWQDEPNRFYIASRKEYNDFVINSSVNNVWSSNIFKTKINDFGKYRLIRTDNICEMQYQDGDGAWEIAGSFIATANDLNIVLYSNQASNEGQCYFDNFIINYGTIVWSPELHPNKNKIYIENQSIDLVKFDFLNKDIKFFTKVPLISSTVDTTFEVYYGDIPDNPNIGSKPSLPTQDVWSNGYIGVYQMDDVELGVSNSLKDSTSFNNLSNVVAGDVHSVNGLTTFDGDTDYINYDIMGSELIDGMDISVEIIFNRSVPISGNECFLHFNSANGHTKYMSFVDCDDVGGIEFGFGIFDVRNVKNDNLPHYAGGALNNSTLIWDVVLENGIFDSIVLGAAPLWSSVGQCLMGCDSYSGIKRRFLNGEIHWVAYSNVMRSEAWRDATRESLFSNLLTLNNEARMKFGSSWLPDWNNRYKINIGKMIQDTTDDIELTLDKDTYPEIWNDLTDIDYTEDNFHGNNGDLPNSDTWIEHYSDQTDAKTLEIQNNSLYFTATGGAIDTSKTDTLIFNINPKNDFVIEMKFDNLVVSGTYPLFGILLSTTKDIVGSTPVALMVGNYVSAFSTYSKINGSLITSSHTMSTYGKLKVVKIGNVLSNYVKFDGDWIMVQTTTLYNNDHTSLGLSFYRYGDTDTVSVNINKFSITDSVSSIDLLENFRNKDNITFTNRTGTEVLPSKLSEISLSNQEMKFIIEIGNLYSDIDNHLFCYWDLNKTNSIESITISGIPYNEDSVYYKGLKQSNQWLTGIKNSIPNTPYNKRWELSIDSSKIDEKLSDFPVLVSLTSSSGITSKDMSEITYPKKLALTIDDGVTQCPVEIESMNLTMIGSISNKLIVSASSSYSTSYTPDYSFNNILSTTVRWASQNSTVSNGIVVVETWYQFSFTEPISLSGLFFYNTGNDASLKDFRCYSSNNGSFSGEEIYLGTFTNTINGPLVPTEAFYFQQNAPFNFLRIYCDSVSGNTATYVDVSEWVLIISDSNQLWTKIPEIKKHTDTKLYLYYDEGMDDNSNIDDIGTVIGQSVWSNNFKIVSHFSDITGNILNSIGIDGTPYNFNYNLVDTDHGIYTQFNGVDEWVEFGNPSEKLDDITIECMIKPNLKNDNVIWNTRNQVNTISNNNGHDQGRLIHNNGTYEMYFVDSLQTDFLLDSLSDSNESSTAIIFNSNNQLSMMYINGVLDSSVFLSNPEFWSTSNGFQVGSMTDNVTSRYYSGLIREFRLSSVTRTPSWIKATYHSNYDNLITLSESSSANYIIDGYITEQGTPVNREVYLYKMSDKTLIGYTTSIAVSAGYYEINAYSDEEHMIMVLDEDGDKIPMASHKVYPRINN